MKQYHNGRPLRTAVAVATERAAARVRAGKASAWASRLDPEAWQVRRFGRGWLAEHPASGQVFQFAPAEGGAVLCDTSSGKGPYLITLTEKHGHDCTCPHAAKTRGWCKHMVAWGACLTEARRRELDQVACPARIAA